MLFERLIALILELWERDKKKYPKNKFDFSIQYDLETYVRFSLSPDVRTDQTFLFQRSRASLKLSRSQLIRTDLFWMQWPACSAMNFSLSFFVHRMGRALGLSSASDVSASNVLACQVRYSQVLR
jgi:hypothetical protein